MQDRFKQLLEEKNLTATKFAALIKVNASAMSHILNGRSKPGFDVLDKIGQAFPDINLNWLISGKGKMYVTDNASKPTPSRNIEKSLFEEEEKGNAVSKEAAIPPPLQPIAQEPTKLPENLPVKHKTIKRIILFFEDGSFEDYDR